ncbi:MAG: hypothetical protein HPKKFMNG_00860 [Planctomycetes bacterium]|nr:hypothetical protein [Planctomycetota bacterium]
MKPASSSKPHKSRAPHWIVAGVLALSVLFLVLGVALDNRWWAFGALELSAANGLILAEVLRRQSSHHERVKQQLRCLSLDLESRHRQALHLQSLVAVLQPKVPFPEFTPVAAAPDLLSHVVTAVLTRKPKLVVEFGSGMSTLAAGLALQKLGLGGRLLSIENDADYLAATRRLVEANGLSSIVEFRHAPLQDFKVKEGVMRWYSPQAYQDVTCADLLLVDGPYDMKCRYPALPEFDKRLAPEALIICDDSRWPDFAEVVNRWAEEFPQWSAQNLETVRGTTILTRSAADPASH